MSHPITVLPPGPERRGLHDQQHLTSGKFPVSARFQGGDDFESTGLSYDDYLGKMHTTQYMLARGRRYETPEWAVNDSQLRKVLVFYLERRAEMGGWREKSERTDWQRIESAQKKLVASDHIQKAAIVRLCQEYADLNQQAELTEEQRKRKKKLAEEIANLDTTIRVNVKIATVVLAIVYAYYRRGLDSKTVAEEMNLRSEHVRMVLWRLERCWERMGGEKPAQRHPYGWRRRFRAIRRIQHGDVKHIDPASVSASPMKPDPYHQYVEFSNRVGAAPLPEIQWRQTFG